MYIKYLPCLARVINKNRARVASSVVEILTEKAITTGSGFYLGEHGRGVYQIHLMEGGGLYLSPLFYPKEDYDGLYMTQDEIIMIKRRKVLD